MCNIHFCSQLFPGKLPPPVVWEVPKTFLRPSFVWHERSLLRRCDALRRRALPSLAEEHHVDGLEHQAPVQKQGEVADVEQVKPQFLDGVLQVLAVAVVHLRPAGDAGADEVPQVVVRDLFFVDLGALRPFSAGADQAHLAAQDVPKLGEFVEPGAAQDGADTGHPFVSLTCVEPARGRRAHGAELPDRKDASPESEAILSEDYRSAAFKKDGCGNKNEHRKQENQGGARDADIDEALDLPGPGATGEAEAFLEDPIRRDAVQIDAPPMGFEEGLNGQDGYLVKVDIDKFLCE